MVTPDELRNKLRPAVEDYAETVREAAEEEDIYPKEDGCALLRKSYRLRCFTLVETCNPVKAANGTNHRY